MMGVYKTTGYTRVVYHWVVSRWSVTLDGMVSKKSYGTGIVVKVSNGDRWRQVSIGIWLIAIHVGLAITMDKRKDIR